MKSLAMKFIAILLAAVCLLTAVGSLAGIFVIGELEENAMTPEQRWEQSVRGEALGVAYAKVRQYNTYRFSTAPKEVIEYLAGQGKIDFYEYGLGPDLQEKGWAVTHADGTRDANGIVEAGEGAYLFHFEAIAPSYHSIHPSDEVKQFLDGDNYICDTVSYGGVEYSVVRSKGPTYAVDVCLSVTQVPDLWSIMLFVWAIGDILPLVLIGSLLLFAVLMVYLCWVAGRKRKTTEIHPAGLNALPLDLFTVIIAFAGFGGVYVLYNIVQYSEFSWMLAGLVVALALLICLLPVIYIFAIAAQVKAKDHFWWRRSVVGFVLIRIYRGLRWCGRGICSVFGMLPIIWQWLLTAALMVIVPAILLLLATACYNNLGRVLFTLMFLGSLVLNVVIVLYGAWCFGTILKGAKRMAAGDLDTKIDTRYLLGSFASCAEHLNALSAAAMIAAREQMKSERMKTELITNVSHDIKTPLTSIINYVDLLQKPHTEEEGEQYLEVLSRQSARLKKLIEDLMEMSKASTGNVHAEIACVDAAEAVHQALGEFADKLETIGLTPVFRQPEEPVQMLADGRLAWRVMSNILSNVVKYAMPGTRLYVDVAKVEGKTMISFKNISAEPLNITAEELMERFVRGDASRNTEGSGLGLNIARSLMEVQNGSLQLLVDGDLFKVTLLFPCS